MLLAASARVQTLLQQTVTDDFSQPANSLVLPAAPGQLLGSVILLVEEHAAQKIQESLKLPFPFLPIWTNNTINSPNYKFLFPNQTKTLFRWSYKFFPKFLQFLPKFLLLNLPVYRSFSKPCTAEANSNKKCACIGLWRDKSFFLFSSIFSTKALLKPTASTNVSASV